jgi:hypothetical protein
MCACVCVRVRACVCLGVRVWCVYACVSGCVFACVGACVRVLVDVQQCFVVNVHIQGSEGPMHLQIVAYHGHRFSTVLPKGYDC